MEQTRKKQKMCLSILMTMLLVFASVPIIHTPTAHAAESPALVTHVYYDPGASNNTFVQEIPSAALFGDSSIEKPAVAKDDPMVAAAIGTAIDNEINRLGGTQGSAFNIKIEWESFEEVSPSIAVEDSAVLSVDATQTNWVFTMSSAGKAQITASVTKGTVAIFFTYQNSAMEEEESSIDVELDNLSNCEIVYSIEIENTQEIDAGAASASDFASVSLQYGGESCAWQHEFMSEYNSVSYDDSQLTSVATVNVTLSDKMLTVTATPLAAGQGELSVTLASSVGAPLTFSVKVSVVKKQINLSDVLITLPWRTRSNQTPYAQGAIYNAESDFAVSDGDLPLFDVSGLEWADNYPTNPQNGATVEIEGIRLTDTAQKNYEFINTLSITVNKSAAYNVSTDKPAGFSLRDKAGNSANENGWFKEDVVATWNGYTLSYSCDSGFTNQLSLNNAEGVYSGQTIYACASDNVVCALTNVDYKLDKQAPHLTAFSVSAASEQLSQGVNMYNETGCDVTIVLSDIPNSTQTSTMNGHTAAVSGISTSEVTYVNSHSGANVTVDSSKLTPSADASTGVFEFGLENEDPESDVFVNSLVVSAIDKAGNVMTAQANSAPQIPENALRLVVDSAAPQIDVSYDNNDVRNGEYYNRSRTATFTITEAHFDLVKLYNNDPVVTITDATGSHALYPDSFESVGDDKWQATHTFTGDADCSVSAQATDLLGRKSNLYEAEFTIDTTDPTLTVVFDNDSAVNGNYYAEGRTATITINEHNFDRSLVHVAPLSSAGNGEGYTAASMSDWTSSGDMHICTVSFPGEGVYSLSISGTDLAENAFETYSCSEFVVDTIKPVIEIQVNGEPDASSHAYANSAPVSVIVNDTNVDSATTIEISAISWNSGGSPYDLARFDSVTEVIAKADDPARSPDNDGVYRITVNAIDYAGNADTKVVDWSVNRFGSTYIMTGDTPEMLQTGYLRSEKLSDVTVMEINPSGLVESETTVNLTQGTRNSLLTPDSDYTFAGGEYAGWPAYNYEIFKGNFNSDGTYQITLHSLDNANHASENTMNNKNETRTNSADIVLSIDDTSPICTFTGIDERSIAASSATVQVNLEDNVALKSAQIDCGNGSVIEVSDIELQRTKSQSVSLSESSLDQVIKVTVTDMAGNQKTYESGSIFVNSNFFLHWLHNIPLFIGTVAIAIAAAVVFRLLFLAKRRKKEEEWK